MKKPPQRIISLAPSVTEILYAIGAGDRVVAVTASCDFPAEAKFKPKVGSFKAVDDSRIRSLEPDLIISSTLVQKDSVKRFNPAGFPVLHIDPRSMKEVFESVVTIGEAVGFKDQAVKLATDLKKAFDSASVKKERARPRVYIEEWHEPPMMSGNWVPDLVRAAGGEYGIIAAGEASRKITTEEVVAYDPQLIVLSLCGYGEKVDKNIIQRRKGWEGITAVKSGKVHVVHDTFLNRPGPRLVEGLKRLRLLL